MVCCRAPSLRTHASFNHSSWMGATCSRHAPRSHYIAGLLEVECEGWERPAQPQRRMDVPGARQPRNARRLFRGPGGRQAPIFRPVSEGGIRRRFRRQPGGESGRDWSMDVGPPVRAVATQGTRSGGSHHGLGNGGCCKVGEPAEESFDTTARDDQHEYDGRSLLETDRGGCRAVPGGRGICCVPK